MLRAMAASLRAEEKEILCANSEDLDAAREKISEVMLDRLRLTEDRIEGMAAGLEQVALLPDPVGKVLRKITRPNGLEIEKVSVPLGVIAIIYESRPNVTADAAALCLKAGSACVLRGGKEAICSNRAIVAALRRGVEQAGFDPDLICLVEDTSRASATELMTAEGKIDLLIPRGGAGLIRACVENATVPCIETGPVSAIFMWMRAPTPRWRYEFFSMQRPAGPASAMQRRIAWYIRQLRRYFYRWLPKSWKKRGSNCVWTPVRQK